MHCYLTHSELGTQDGGLNGAILIGRIPLMLRSDRCVLRGKGEEELARVGAPNAVCLVDKLCMAVV